MDWKRVIMEAVVIVASILMAFGIDAWWDRTQAGAAEREFLGQVHVELTESREILTASLEDHREFLDSAQVVSDYGSASVPRPAPSQRAVARTFFTFNTTHFKTGVLDGALASAQLGLVTNQALRGHLAGWPGTWGEFREEEIWIRTFLTLYTRSSVIRS